ncbi:flagellar assembly protein FliW [Candidatus Sumerlaeota bacterium]|nr:flagellar assembly protein FliW [Candidatus Sumerlaeota bacterium]
MEIQTTRFGVLQFPRDLVIRVPGGLPGFPHAEGFAVLEHDTDGSPFKWLQAVDEPALAFIIIDPHLLVPDYLAQIERDVHDAFGPFDPQDVSTISLVTVPRDNPTAMTANLRAPLVVIFSERVGRQIILTDDRFPMNHRIFPPSARSERAVAG